MNHLEINKEYVFMCPFKTGTYSYYDEDGLCEEATWIPGYYFDNETQDEFIKCADGLGKVIYKIIDIHKPGKYPTRVFYIRNWVDPDGKKFGSNKLHITTEISLKRRMNYHDKDVICIL